MCQARASVYFSSVLIWKVLSSLTFGFCSIWCLHFVAVLACELDLPIDIDVPLTILSSILAVIFTFAALAFDPLLDMYRQGKWHKGRFRRRGRKRRIRSEDTGSALWSGSFKPGDFREHNYEDRIDAEEDAERDGLLQERSYGPGADHSSPPDDEQEPATPMTNGHSPRKSIPFTHIESATGTSTPSSASSISGVSHTHGLTNIAHFAHESKSSSQNPFVATGRMLYQGCSRRNLVKGFSWSLAVTGMHYSGIAALRIPEGHYTLNPILVVLSGLLSWATCLVGVILMASIETQLAQQLLFSLVAAFGVAAMHFTGTLIFGCQQARLITFRRHGSNNILFLRSAVG